MSREIRKKVSPAYFEEILSGNKTFEARLADWECSPGDTLVLQEKDDSTKQLTGRELRRKVGYVGKTKDFSFFSQMDIDRYGYQIISLLPEQS